MFFGIDLALIVMNLIHSYIRRKYEKVIFNVQENNSFTGDCNDYYPFFNKLVQIFSKNEYSSIRTGISFLLINDQTIT